MQRSSTTRSDGGGPCAAWPACLMGGAGLAVLALLALAPQEGAPVALVFPPWVPPGAALSAALGNGAALLDIRAGGRLIVVTAPGGVAHVPGTLALAARPATLCALPESGS
ncbi:MAG: hypothetical protein JJU40_04810 [Rhodobacteraceae bacterium]|nr:hypothetical protein [Paracoccaceae bacterium]